MDGERAQLALECELEIAALEHDSVGLGEHGHQHLVGEGRIDGVPVDVEEVRVDRGLPVLEYIHPPRIVGAHDANVIRHDVEDMTHGVRAQLRHEQLEVLATADFRIERVVIDDVIAVCTARARAEIGRAVDVTHAQRGEVGDDRRQVFEGEAGIELHAVSGARNPRRRPRVGGFRLRHRDVPRVSARHGFAPGAR